jgi:hypothetical protein
MKYLLALLFIVSITVVSEANSSVVAFKNVDVISMQSEKIDKDFTVLRFPLQEGNLNSLGTNTCMNAMILRERLLYLE